MASPAQRNGDEAGATRIKISPRARAAEGGRRRTGRGRVVEGGGPTLHEPGLLNPPLTDPAGDGWSIRHGPRCFIFGYVGWPGGSLHVLPF